MEKTDIPYSRRRKWLAGISLAVVTLLAALLTVFIWRWLDSFSQEDFREYIQSFGPLGRLVLLGLQILQIFIALIPGELLESAAGFAFGPWLGTAICYAGLVIGSGMVFLLTRKFGVRLVEVFFPKNKIAELSFLKNPKKTKAIALILMTIPGTPKDFLSYFAGLTQLTAKQWLSIVAVSRIPSLMTSVISGAAAGEENYVLSIVMLGITLAISMAGMVYYRRICKQEREAKET
jgi:uncharacterized membrane protein YdjX (TVP38/TMEM64 family)